jgi:hypothetical protein
MLRPLYARPPDRKPSCRFHLKGETGRNMALPPQFASLCQTHVLPWLPAAVVRCANCSMGGCLSERSVSMCPIPTKETREKLATSCGLSSRPTKTWESFPELWAFLTCEQSPDGGQRQGGKLSLSFEQGLWKLVLTDVHTSLYACLTGEDPDGLVLMAEARLGESSVPWRKSSYPQSKKK